MNNKDNNNNKGLTIAANTLSGVFLPLLTATYAYICALWTTPLSMIPENIRFKSSIVIFILTAVIPLATILYLMRRGLVSDVSINNPAERKIPYVVTILCYAAAAFYLMRMPSWLPLFFVGAFVSSILASIITLWWKISAHCMALGGLCAMLIYIGVNHIANVMIIPWIAIAILISGAVGSSRIYLGRHTPAQVYCGWLLGAVCTYLCMSL